MDDLFQFKVSSALEALETEKRQEHRFIKSLHVLETG